MNAQEYELLQSIKPVHKVLTVDDLENKSPRTLLYGYTIERMTWHVYLNEQGEIVVMEYDRHTKPVQKPVQENQDFVPSKRLYPERCDFEFCKLLTERNIYLSFTTADFEDFQEKRYYGATIKEH